MGVDGQQTIGTRAMPGQIVGLSANGQRDANQNITLDGVSATDGFKSVHAVCALDRSDRRVQDSERRLFGRVRNELRRAGERSRSRAARITGTAPAFEFLRNDTLRRARLLPRPNQPKNKLRRNQFGGVFSGPILRDKTFFLVNYEGRRERRGTPSRTTVPTVAMRNGDFSEILQPGNRWYPSDANPAVTRAIRFPGRLAPFPNNIIPRSLLNPVSLNILTCKKGTPLPEGGFMPLPNFDDAGARGRITH